MPVGLSRSAYDFLLMLEHGTRIVMEVDGRQNYAAANDQGRWTANAQKYAEMALEDRRLRLAGYEVFSLRRWRIPGCRSRNLAGRCEVGSDVE